MPTWRRQIRYYKQINHVVAIHEKEVMERRFMFLGYMDDHSRPLKTYFRREDFALHI